MVIGWQIDPPSQWNPSMHTAPKSESRVPVSSNIITKAIVYRTGHGKLPAAISVAINSCRTINPIGHRLAKPVSNLAPCKTIVSPTACFGHVAYANDGYHQTQHRRGCHLYSLSGRTDGPIHCQLCQRRVWLFRSVSFLMFRPLPHSDL